MKIIPTFIHGISDYLVGVILLVAPNLFGFAEAGGAAVAVPRFVGIMILAQALMTNYELGVIRKLPMRVHLTMDYILSIFLLLSPWIFGFHRQPSNVWMPHVIVGALVFLLTLMTESEPRTAVSPAHR
ncbi:MAG TPA: SPW repeat protein [Candidatus Saccharimonadales bacterium]|nr:SPW repeat protein [Candidatus Saccharimonadales bacterium]